MSDRVQRLLEHAQLLHRSILDAGLEPDIEGLAAELCTYLQLRSQPPTPASPASPREGGSEGEDGEGGGGDGGEGGGGEDESGGDGGEGGGGEDESGGDGGEGDGPGPAPPDLIRPAEAMALASPTGANAWLGEFLLATEGRPVRYDALGPELVPDRPVTLWHAKRTPVPNAVRLEDVPLDRLLDVVCKPSEQAIGAIDVLLLSRFDAQTCVANLVQVKLGGSKMHKGTDESTRSSTVQYVVRRMRERGEEVLRRLGEAYPDVRFVPVYHLWTTRPLSAPARAWLAAADVALRDRPALWPAWPPRVRAWARGQAAPHCPHAPAWLAPGY